MPSISLGMFHFWMGMVALVARWFSLLDVAKTAFFAPFIHLQVNSWNISILLYALDPPCPELHAKHQFGEISLLDGHGCPGFPVVFLAGCGKNCIFGTILIAYSQFLDYFHSSFCIRSPLPRATWQVSVWGDSTFGWAWLPWLPSCFPCWM